MSVCESKSLLVNFSRYFLPSVCNSLHIWESVLFSARFVTQAAISVCILPFPLPPWLLSLHLLMPVSSLFHIRVNPPRLHIYFWCLSLTLHANITSPCFLITSTPDNTHTHTHTHTHPWVSCVSVSHRCMIPPLFDSSPVAELWPLNFAHDPLGVSTKPQGSEPGRAVRRIQPLHQWVDRWRPLLAYEDSLCRYVVCFFIICSFGVFIGVFVFCYV